MQLCLQEKGKNIVLWVYKALSWISVCTSIISSSFIGLEYMKSNMFSSNEILLIINEQYFNYLTYELLRISCSPSDLLFPSPFVAPSK